ncbi:ECF transporter S component [Gulosibacter hominis]|uniref:ECF transporter S component n=1 Tax=Gulosibacter hominis TaxID=2770504 RepID=UPI0019182A61|nr:ECF transporter S component [Gulosibacter hominis]
MKNVSTRLLMACAALGVAGGMLFTAHAWVGALTVNTIPFLYGLTMGIYFLPGTLAQVLFRRPGVALLTTGLAGLVASPFQLIGFQALLISLAVGVAQELPFVVSGYRYWKRWVFWVAGLAYGLLVTGAAFGILRGGELSALGATLVVISFFISPPIFTAVALWLADALAKAGVARGLRRSEARPLPTDPTESTGK